MRGHPWALQCHAGASLGTPSRSVLYLALGPTKRQPFPGSLARVRRLRHRFTHVSHTCIHQSQVRGSHAGRLTWPWMCTAAVSCLYMYGWLPLETGAHCVFSGSGSVYSPMLPASRVPTPRSQLPTPRSQLQVQARHDGPPPEEAAVHKRRPASFLPPFFWMGRLSTSLPDHYKDVTRCVESKEFGVCDTGTMKKRGVPDLSLWQGKTERLPGLKEHTGRKEKGKKGLPKLTSSSRRG